MKTDTKDKIYEMIQNSGTIRPADLHKALHISPQALHRHLRALKNKGLIEVQGAGPQARYIMTGIPDFEMAAHWIKQTKPHDNSEAFICETRSIFTGRLTHLKSFVQNGLSENLLPLVISTAGEIGNNSFDHNLGQWRDVPGCWFEPRVNGKQLWIWIADRGQGIFHSLIRVHPEIVNEDAALKAAFETIISGRAPEQRGNGLKFVKNTLSAIPGSGVSCISGTALISYGEKGESCAAVLKKYFTHIDGTATLLLWRLQ